MNYTLIKCLGEDNVTKAVNQYVEEGWTLHSVVPSGLQTVKHHPLEVQGKTVTIMTFLVIMEKMDA